MSERYFHGSLSKLNPGDVIHSTDELHKRGMLSKQFSGLSMAYDDVAARHHEGADSSVHLEDGSKVNRTSLTYHSTDPVDAEDWAARPLLKSSPEDFQRMASEHGIKHLNVYEVSPVNPRRPVNPHSDAEVVADRAVVKGLHSTQPLDRYCVNKECGDYMGSWSEHIPHCPTCGHRQPPA